MAGLGGLSHDALELWAGAGREGPGGIVRVGPQHGGPLPPQPFTPEAAPIEFEGEGAEDSRLDARTAGGLIGVLQPSPVRSDEPMETVTLIPMGGGPAAGHRLPDHRRRPGRARLGRAAGFSRFRLVLSRTRRHRRAEQRAATCPVPTTRTSAVHVVAA